MTVLTTERLQLRPARTDDLDAFHAILSDPKATQFWSTPPHTTIEQSRAWLDSMIEIPPGEGEDFVIEREGQVIGKAGFYRFPEIGFILHPDHWGHGYAQEALRPVIARAFAVHRLPTIEADVDPDNIACLKLLDTLCFRETGREQRTMKIGDKWCDSVYLALDAPTIASA